MNIFIRRDGSKKKKIQINTQQTTYTKYNRNMQ